MDIDADIRRIARETARDVFREEIEQLQQMLGAQRTQDRAPEPLLTVEDVAKLCSVGTKTVQRWIAKGLLRAMRSPGMREYRITHGDFQSFATGKGRESNERSRSDDIEGEASNVLAAALSPRRARR